MRFTPRRPLGRTGFVATSLGIGDVADRQAPLETRVAKVSSGGAHGGAAQLPRLTVDDCVRYTLSCDPDVALLGLSFPNEQDAAFAAAMRFSPMSDAELAATRLRAAEAMEGKGRVWWNPGGEPGSRTT